MTPITKTIRQTASFVLLVVFASLGRFESTVLAGGSIAQGHSCSSDYIYGSEPFDEWYQCVPRYAKTQAIARCNSSGSSTQSTGWMVPKVDGNYTPWQAERAITSGTIDGNNNVQLALFASRYNCTGAKSTGSGEHQFWFPSESSSIKLSGMKDYKCRSWRKYVDNCPGSYHSGESPMCRSRFDEISSNQSAASIGLISAPQIMTPVRGTATSYAGEFSGIAGNGHFEGIRLNVDKFREYCLREPSGTPGICEKLDSSNYSFKMTITSDPYTNNTVCGNLTPNDTILYFKSYTPVINVVLFASSSVNPTMIYPTQTAQFSHQTGASSIEAQQGASNVEVNFWVVDVDPNNLTKPIGGNWYNNKIRTKVITTSSPTLPAESYYNNFQAKLSDAGKKVCRRVWWETFDLGKNPKKIRSGDGYKWGWDASAACISILKPTFEYSVDLNNQTKTTVDKDVIAPNTIATFAHDIYTSIKTNYPGNFNTRFTVGNGGSNTVSISNPASPVFKDIKLSYGTRPADGSLPVRTLTKKDVITESHKATQDHVGGRVCRQVNYLFNPENNADYKLVFGEHTGHSTQACVEIPYQYELIPRIKVNGNTADAPVIPGTNDVPISGSINNNGPTKSKDTRWVLSRFVLNSGQQPNHFGYDKENINSQQPSSFFNHRYAELASGRNVFQVGDTLDFIVKNFNIPPNAQVGEKYCFTLSVQPYKAEWQNGQLVDNKWRHAMPICLIVSKQPTTQVHGAGLILPRGGTKGSLTKRPDGTQYGSWMEYDILAARRADTVVASNAGHLINLGLATQSQWHQLTIANTPELGLFGTNLPTNRAQVIRDHYLNLAKAHTLTGSSLVINLSSYAYTNKLNYLYHNGSSLRLTGTLPANRSLVIIQDGGDVVIEGNLTYAKQTGFATAADYSQLIIIANNGNILINDNVTRVEAWLVALGSNQNQGRLQTCRRLDTNTNTWITSTANVHTCTNQLVVNGPVITDYVDLLRTYGNDVTKGTLGQPAEIFNFRPDAYLWATGKSDLAPIYEITYSRELPARY